MKAEEIKAFFPRKCLITQKLIDSKKSIGTELLKSFLPEELHEDIFWGLSIGNVRNIKLKTEQDYKDITMPLYLDSSITKPMEIEFKLRN